MRMTHIDYSIITNQYIFAILTNVFYSYKIRKNQTLEKGI